LVSRASPSPSLLVFFKPSSWIFFSYAGESSSPLSISIDIEIDKLFSKNFLGSLYKTDRMKSPGGSTNKKKEEKKVKRGEEV